MKGRRIAMLAWAGLLGLFCGQQGWLAQAAAKQGGALTSRRSISEAWTPEDMVFVDIADQFRISPDGKWALWLKTVPDKKNDTRVSRLVLSSMTENEEIPLTRALDNVAQPRWSPDGRLIAFLSSRTLPDANAGSGKQQIWLINPFGGEPWPASSTELRINHFEWGDNNTIIFSAREDPLLYETEMEAKKDDTKVVDDTQHTPAVRLFRLTLKDTTVIRLTDNDRWIQTFEVSPDGKWAAVMESRGLSYQWDRKESPAFWIANLANGQRKPIFNQGDIHPRVIKWAADSSGVYAIVPRSEISPDPVGFARALYFYDFASDAVTKVNLEWDRGVNFTQRFEVAPDGFVILLADGVRFKPARYTRHGATWSREWIQGEHDRNYYNLIPSPDGRTVIYEYSTASVPWQWYRAKLDGARVVDPVLLVDVYPQLRKKTLAKTEVIHWKGANDDEVEGLLYYPHDFQSGKRYPLVTYTHGGPMAADLDAWSANPAYTANLLNQRGAFVLATNYHGSANYGAKWAESICCGKYYDLEIPDIEKGVDNLIAKGLVDPDRIGAFGWSNGAILTTKLTVVNPERYKAAVLGAGDVEYISEWGNSIDGQAVDSFYLGKSFAEDPELYIRKSPIFQLDRVRTPTLIMHGTADLSVPPNEGKSHYRSLYFFQKAPVRLVLFPDEGHFPGRPSHQLRLTTEEMAWFDKYLFHANAPKSEAVKDGSLLDEALRHPFRKVGSLYGIEQAVGGSSGSKSAKVLVPEVVNHGASLVGRFEVTRAQYAAFDKNFKYERGTENYPANGISYEQAKAYCAWLSKVTEQSYRLPNEDESKSLYSKRAGENTLNYWAGYSVNPDDAKQLAEPIAGLQPDVLLKQVGSFAGVAENGEESVFDLGGNVAEWVETKGGSGKLFGGSADQPADPKARSSTANISFAGFRVVNGAPKH